MFITTLFRKRSYNRKSHIFIWQFFRKSHFVQEKNIFHKVVINRFVKNVYICEQKEPKI